ncbi:hypothetical protein LCL95_01620 [Bacillus timonensis]|nr:hypothetical protein [Bacillus timonensis]
MKRVVKISVFILLAIVLIYYGNTYMTYYKMKNEFKEPYVLVEKMIEEAINNEEESSYSISEQEWTELSETSVYKRIRRPLDWSAFKGFVQACQPPTYSLSYPNGNATSKVMENYYKENHRTTSVTCFEYNEENGDQIGVSQINLLMGKIKGSWKVVGVTQE